MNKLTRSWNIFKKSMIVINREKKLLIFPLFSCIAMIMLILLILTGVVTLVVLSPDTVPEATTTASTTTAADSENVSLVAKLIELAVYFVLYLITMLISNFCSTAFFYEIFRAFNGDQASISRGFRYALSRFKAIFLWSLVASTIGVILRALQERAGLLGQIALKLVGVVWAVASCFVTPALVMDPNLNNPFQALKRSANTIAQTWGESLIGFVGINVVSTVAFLIMLAIDLVLGISIALLEIWLPQAILMGMLFLSFIFFGYLVGVAQSVYKIGLYQYANGVPNNLFTQEEIAGAFRAKK